ncbi:UPF0182 family protein [Gryllotalpicola kribbensis]|uniref:UPF0182 protein GCM10022288_08450 n=1 Tax=Gryllotalpicola kribbensis TaxID=993084 RepID=A0ABP8ALA8_9MICO
MWITIGAIVVLVIAFFIFASLFTDVLWFQQLGYLGVLTTQWWWGLGMFAVGFLGMGFPLWLSIQLAYRLRPVYARLNTQLDRYQQVVEPLRRLAMWGVPIVFGLFAGVASASRWQVAAQWLHSTPFGSSDPQFHIDDSFYIFRLPFYHSVVSFSLAVLIIAFLATIATAYLYGSIRVSGREVRISRSARVQIAVIGAVYMGVQALSIWLARFDTLTNSNVKDSITGAAYTDVHATIPARTILAGIAVIVGLVFVLTAVTGRWRYPMVGLGLLIVSAIVIGTLYPWGVQKFTVDPSEKPKETAYVSKAIDATRDAYGVSDINVQSYDATSDTPAGALREDADTTASIRLLDPTVVSPAFSQLQQFRQYYSFQPDLDVDRYTIDGKSQDTVVSVRELDQKGLGSSTQNWFNDTFVYTHGYGLVAAAGNERQDDGAPQFIESGIPTSTKLGDYQPRIYFGQDSPAYSIVGAPKGGKPVELDYPAGKNGKQATYNTYTGDGGPKLSNVFVRLLYALKFQDEQIVLSDQVNSDSQILYNRDPAKRVKEVAPFLTLDSNPYPSVVDGHIEWIIDGYTTSDQYPYSMRQSLSGAIADSDTERQPFAMDDVNYIRNSVKATVDAYTGKVTLYAWDASDPVLKTWQKILPLNVKPVSDMSAQLMSHVRYPEDLFKMQRQILASYHVTDAGAFFSNEDVWKTPSDPSKDTSTVQPPYYLTMKLPGEKSAAYTLYSTYIPASSQSTSRNILKGYLAVDSDAGSAKGKPSKDYGKLTLLRISNDNVWGPGQVFATAESDPDIAKQLSLLRSTTATTVDYGNLLTIPVGGGMLYVEPVYVKSTGSTSYPLLQEVIVSFGSKVVMQPTLDAALDELFGGNSGAPAGDKDTTPTTPPAASSDGSGNGTSPTTPPTSTPSSTPKPTQSAGDSAELKQAIADAQSAYDDAQDALKNGDWTAYGDAQSRLQDALQRAADAEGGK